MSSSAVDLLWVVIVGTSTVLVLAIAFIASLVISHRQKIAAQEEKMNALRESEARFRNLVENINDIYYISDVRGRMVYGSPNLFSSSGYTEQEIIGQTYIRLLAREDCRRVVDHYSRCMNDGTLDTSYEFRARRKDGTTVWVEQTTRILRENGGTVTGFQNIVRDVTERKQAEEILKNFTTRVIEAQESERKRIARELHDSIGQMLSAVKFRLHDVLEETAGKPRDPRTLAEMYSLLERTLQEVRRVSQNLRPSVLDDLGLLSAVRTLCDEFKSRTGMGVQLSLPAFRERFPAEVELALFRIIQEAINNVEKHADASTLAVLVERQNSSLQVAVIDNGKGFSPELLRGKRHRIGGIGLESIRERSASIGATVEISSAIGRGSEITLHVPLPAEYNDVPENRHHSERVDP